MKKLLSLSLVLVMLLSVAFVGASAASPEDFSDIPDDWSREGIISAVENGLLYGTDGKILPNDNLTRAQLAAIINRALNAKVMADVSGFTDVPAGAWFYEDIAKAVQAGTFGGDGNKMRPNDPITREETFVVLARAFLFPDGSVSGLNTYTDAGSVSEWAKNGVSALVGEGYVKGDNNNRINPKSNITRAEFATIMHRLVSEYISEPAEITEVTGDNVMINVADVTLKDVTINGNLYIGDGVGNGDVTLSGVTVSGRLAIRAGGADSIKIIGNSNIGTIIISRRDGIVRVYVEDGSEIEVVYIEDGNGDIIFEGSADSMIIEGEDVTVRLRNGSINVATINGKNSRIIVEEDASIGLINVNASGVSISGDGNVDKVVSTFADVSVTTKGTEVVKPEPPKQEDDSPNHAVIPSGSREYKLLDIIFSGFDSQELVTIDDVNSTINIDLSGLDDNDIMTTVKFVTNYDTKCVVEKLGIEVDTNIDKSLAQIISDMFDSVSRPEPAIFEDTSMYEIRELFHRAYEVYSISPALFNAKGITMTDESTAHLVGKVVGGKTYNMTLNVGTLTY
jgi:hypothetical protein